MMSWKLSLLFFSAVTLHGCLSDTAESEVQDESCIRKVVALYNQMEGDKCLYKSFDPLPSVPLEGEEKERGYIIKETECLKSENPDLAQCDYNPDGDMKICDCDADDDDPEDMMCVRVPSVPSVAKENRPKRGLRRLKKWIKKNKRRLLNGAALAYNIFG